MLNFIDYRSTIGFVILNEKAIVLILVVMATNLKKGEMVLKNSINLQSFNQI